MINENKEVIDFWIKYQTLIIAFFGGIVTILGVIIKIQSEKFKNIKSQLSEKKYNLYSKVYSVFFLLVDKNPKLSDSEIKEEIETLLKEIKKEMFIYAPDIVLKKFLQWNNNIENETDPLKRINNFNQLLILIRKDMGNSRTKIKRDDIIRSILSSEQEFLNFKEQTK
ncbi:hypothetical protein [uncultured Polaribacter sp.]|uniref:hypothetical protein n=1 Tax=uncultured Polaribacter sp. TaxID=174711 RepID=UPI00262E02FB|nr:hypothetical protein [uncultured Polaribacter sp.]